MLMNSEDYKALMEQQAREIKNLIAVRENERERIQEDIRSYCNSVEHEYITYPEVLKIINNDMVNKWKKG